MFSGDLTWKGRLFWGGVGCKESDVVVDMSCYMGGRSWLPM